MGVPSGEGRGGGPSVGPACSRPLPRSARSVSGVRRTTPKSASGRTDTAISTSGTGRASPRTRGARREASALGGRRRPRRAQSVGRPAAVVVAAAGEKGLEGGHPCAPADVPAAPAPCPGPRRSARSGGARPRVEARGGARVAAPGAEAVDALGGGAAAGAVVGARPRSEPPRVDRPRVVAPRGRAPLPRPAPPARLRGRGEGGGPGTPPTRASASVLREVGRGAPTLAEAAARGAPGEGWAEGPGSREGPAL